MKILMILVCIIWLGLACAIWMLVWGIFEETELGAIIVNKIKNRKGGDDE